MNATATPPYPEPTPPAETLPSKKKLYKKWWFWVILVIITMVPSTYLINKNSIIGKTCSNCGIFDFKEKFYTSLFEKRCSWAGGVAEKIARGGPTCYNRSPQANHDCLQNSDCNGGACQPIGVYTIITDAWTSPRVNQDGYIIGRCSDALYTPVEVTDDFGKNTMMYCGSSIYSPSQPDSPDIVTLFCD